MKSRSCIATNGYIEDQGWDHKQRPWWCLWIKSLLYLFPPCVAIPESGYHPFLSSGQGPWMVPWSSHRFGLCWRLWPVVPQEGLEIMLDEIKGLYRASPGLHYPTGAGLTSCGPLQQDRWPLHLGERTSTPLHRWGWTYPKHMHVRELILSLHGTGGLIWSDWITPSPKNEPWVELPQNLPYPGMAGTCKGIDPAEQYPQDLQDTDTPDELQWQSGEDGITKIRGFKPD